MIEQCSPESSGPISVPRSSPRERSAEGSRSLVKWATLGWLGAIFLLPLGSAAIGSSLYRPQHLGTALEYAKGSINLLKPVIVGWNLNGAPTPLELPLWQGAAALAFKLFGPWFGWANL